MVPPPVKAAPKTRISTSSTTPTSTSRVTTYRGQALSRSAQDINETDFSMVSPSEESTEDQIKALEERIAILKAQTPTGSR